MGINTSPLRGEEKPIQATKSIQANTRHQISTLEISLDIPHPVSTKTGKRDLVPSLISISSYSRRKTTMSSTTSWLSSRQVNDS